MRPVTKPDLASSGYTEPASLTWTARHEAYGSLCRYFGGNSKRTRLTVPIADCLQAWLDIKAKPASSRTGREKLVLPAVKDKVTTEYKKADVPLINGLGSFCSYCESPLPALVEVEHVAPKDPYPAFSTSWKNFLMCCGPCNTQKRSQPPRATVRKWLPTPTTEDDYYTLIRNRYLWPDKYTDTFQNFRHYLYFLNKNDQYRRMSLADSVDLRTVWKSTNIADRTVTADIVHNGTLYQDATVRVYHRQSWNNGDQDEQLFDLCGLDRLGDTGRTYDRRVLNRTVAWFTAMAQVRHLTSFTRKRHRDQFQSAWSAMLLAVAGTGFWSVFVTVLSQFTDLNGKNMGEQFYKDTLSQGIYPGTDTSDIELPA